MRHFAYRSGFTHSVHADYHYYGGVFEFEFSRVVEASVDFVFQSLKNFILVRFSFFNHSVVKIFNDFIRRRDRNIGRYQNVLEVLVKIVADFIP